MKKVGGSTKMLFLLELRIKTIHQEALLLRHFFTLKDALNTRNRKVFFYTTLYCPLNLVSDLNEKHFQLQTPFSNFEAPQFGPNPNWPCFRFGEGGSNPIVASTSG
jgi:hypothetical protein